MKVICPECNFSSEIPEDKIPANAQLATCPKCGIKFQFRELPVVEEEVESEMENVSYHGDNNQHPDNTVPRADSREQGMQSYGSEEYQQIPEQEQTTPEYSSQENSYEQDQYVQQPDSEFRQQSDPDQPYVQNRQEYTQDQPSHEAGNPEHSDEPHSNRVRVEADEQPEKADIWQRLDSMRPNVEETEDHNYEIPEGEATEVPFENLEKYGFFPGLFLTIKKIILSPGPFFRNMELSGFIKPLIFFILLAEFQEICNFIWATTGIDTSMTSDVGRMVNDSVIAEAMSEGTTSALFSLLLYPLMLAGLSFPLISFTHVLLMIFGAGERGFQATFRATTYSYAPIILCVIPLVGDMIGALISVAISIIAYKNIHNTTYMRVVLSMVMPIVLLLVILGFYMNFNQPTI